MNTTSKHIKQIKEEYFTTIGCQQDYLEQMIEQYLWGTKTNESHNLEEANNLALYQTCP